MKHLFAALFFSFVFVQNFQASSGRYYGGEDISTLQASEQSKEIIKPNSKIKEEERRIEEKRKKIKEIEDKIKNASITDTLMGKTTEWKKNLDKLKMEFDELQKALIRNHMTVSIWRIKITGLKEYDGWPHKGIADIVINYCRPNTRTNEKLINRDNCGSSVDLQFEETEIHADACLEFWDDDPGRDEFITTISLNELYQKAKFQIEEKEKFSNEGTYEVKIDDTTYKIFYKTGFKK